jgi:aspartate aminotransferase-like enzyme
MSKAFQGVMNEISSILKDVYNAQNAVIVPGSGTYGMEAVARQFATNKKCLVIRNGWFSYRWTQIFDAGNIPSEQLVLKASQTGEGDTAPFEPAPIEKVVETIIAEKPDVVFAAHVETSAGIILPDDYIQAVAQAVHENGGLFVLDCIASGTIWIDMKANGVDVLISAPQKGWSGSPCCGLVMLNDRAVEQLNSTSSTSFACDLRKWHEIMQAYENGGHAYHATMPTDSLVKFRDVMNEAAQLGFNSLKQKQIELGERIRGVLEAKGIQSVAAQGFKAPAVVVSYTDDDLIQNGRKFAEAGMQIAAGVPLMCDEPEGYKTFRLGLFGLDKLTNVDRTVNSFEQALSHVI